MQNITEANIRDLLDKYVTGTITAADKSLLSDILAKEEYLSTVEKILEEEYMSGLYMTDDNLEIGKSIQLFLQDRVATKTNFSHSVKKRSFPLFRWAAAACLLIALGAAAYYFLSGKEVATIQHQLAQDLPPGTEGAILTLANGKQIVLDSNFNGTLTEEGGINITQKDNQIQYAADGKQNTVLHHTMSTPRGRQYKLVLSDGSKLWLNAASSVTYPTAFSGNERIVEVTGEVYFEVAHNASKPFKVKLKGGSLIQVLGTHFNVNNYDENLTKTTLLQGSVKLMKNTTSLVLKPGQQGKATATTLQLEKNVDLDQVMAWRNGYFSFKNSDFKNVIQQLSLWYDFDVVYKSSVPNINFSGEIGKKLTLSEVLDILKETRIKATIEGRKLIIQ